MKNVLSIILCVLCFCIGFSKETNLKQTEKMQIDLKEDFDIIEDGTQYELPCYEVIEKIGIQKTNKKIKVDFVRGLKLGSEKVDKKEGTLHEHILAMVIYDLKFKNNIVSSREGSIAITKLQEALQWLRERQVDRKKREVEGTYKE